ncbi:(Fe-S)-binding protein [Candidatus Zixiibacteriota bacterium]
MAEATLQKTLSITNAFRCLECGKCTAVCPISRYNGSYSPRRIVGRLITEDPANVAMDPNVWTCLACGLCNARCPSDVKYGAMTKVVRSKAFQLHNEPSCSHGGALQAMMRIHATSNQPQDRMGWVTDDLKVAEKGEWGYFVGCLPYFDALFSDLESNSVAIAQSVVKILNELGIEPVVMKDERCCGHDLLWGGDTANFKLLAERNVKMIRETGVKKVVTACPECYRTLAKDYPEVIGEPLGFEMVYITELLADMAEQLEQKLGKIEKTVSFQDPCRLGRHMGIFESPRKMINLIPGITFNEMTKRGPGAICCGTSAWQNCDATSKRIQTDRLLGAHNVGAELMVTSCPKCYVHFKCALQGETIPEDKKVEVKDLIVLLAEALNGR